MQRAQFVRGRGHGERRSIAQPSRSLPVTEAVVKAVVAVLPELVFQRFDREAPPDLGPRHRAFAVLRPQPLDPLLELAPPAHDLALPRRARRELRAGRPRFEVAVGLVDRHALDEALDANLAAELVPVEAERRVWVLLQLAALAALVARVEDEALLVRALQEHEPDGRKPVRRRGGQCDRVGPGRARRAGRLVPGVELPQRIGIEVAPPQRLRMNLVAAHRP